MQGHRTKVKLVGAVAATAVLAALGVSSEAAASSVITPGVPCKLGLLDLRTNAGLQIRCDNRSGGVLYRLGDNGMWMN